MRVWLVLCLLLSGCVVTSSDDVDPSVSVSYSKSSSTQNGVTKESISATLTSARGIDDWSELQVTGCAAPESGPIETPHKFTGCSGRLTIRHAESGDVLYRSS